MLMNVNESSLHKNSFSSSFVNEEKKFMLKNGEGALVFVTSKTTPVEPKIDQAIMKSDQSNET